MALADPEQARAAARTMFARYGTLANYQKVFEREGVQSAADLAIVGTESDLERQLRRYADAGVTELWAAVFPVGDDSEASMDRTRAVLADLRATV